MFFCNGCQSASKPREEQTKKIVQTREKVYTRREYYGWNQFDEIVIGKGSEIIKEVNLCVPCAEADDAVAAA